MDIRPNHFSWTCIAGVLAWVSWGWGQEQRGLPELGIPESFGVNIHFTSADERQLQLLSGSGNRFIRMDFGWGGTERNKGQYDFGAYDRLVGDMSKLGIRCLLILDYSNRLYDGGLSPNTEEGRAAFARWAAAGAAHFKGKGILWEIWNEPNISQFWKPRPNADDYSKLALVTIEAIRKADPEAFIMAPASSTFPWDFFETMGKAGVFARLDAVSVHPYRQQDPETAEADYCRLRLLLEKYAPGRKLPIVSGEWGYSTAWGGMNDEKQANYLVRQRLMNLWMGVPLSIWYDWHDDGPDPKEAEHHFGTVYLDFKPKPSYIAGKVLAETLGGYRFVRRLAMGTPKDYLMLFGDDKKAALAVWTLADPHAMKVNVRAKDVSIVSRDGQRKTATTENGHIELQLTPAPQYILFEDSADAPLLIGQPAATMHIVKAGAASIPLALRNPGRSEWSTRVHINEGAVVIGETDSLSIRAGQSKSVDAQIVSPRRDVQHILAEVELREEPEQSAWIWVLQGNPLHVSVLPVVDRNITILADNLSAQAVELELRIKSDKVIGSPRLKLASGARGMVAFQAADKLADDAIIGVEALDGQGNVIAQTSPVRWRATASLDAEWSAGVSGDAKVGGSGKAGVVDLADPPQPGLKKAVRVDYQFAAGWKYAPIQIGKEGAAIEGKPAIVGMWVFGNGSSDVLRCTVKDNTGQTFQHSYGPITWTGWKWITMPLDGTDAGHWGGANDGVIHYPIQWESPMLIDGMRLKVDQSLQVRATGFAVGY